MQRFLVTCGVFLLALVAVAGCAGTDPETAAEEAREEQWQQIDQAKQELEGKREELREARAAAAEESDEAAEETAEAAAEGEDGAEAAGEAAEAESAADRVARLQKEVDEGTQELVQQLVDFINANPPVAGETPPERVQQAIRMKSDEDILVARDYIERGGDYRRAIDIYDAALTVDPDYGQLQELKAEAEDMRYMTEERFALVKKGMTQDEVRAALGPVNLRNIRDFEENNSVAWFYPKDGAGSAAAVWFNKPGRSDTFQVYEADYDFKNAGEGDEG